METKITQEHESFMIAGIWFIFFFTKKINEGEKTANSVYAMYAIL